MSGARVRYLSTASKAHLISMVVRNCNVPTHAIQSSQLVVQLFNQDLQMAFRLRSEAIIPLHGCCRRIVQRQVKAPEQVCDLFQKPQIENIRVLLK